MVDRETGAGGGEDPAARAVELRDARRNRRPLPDDPDELAAELKFLREEVDLLRRRLETAPGRIRTLEERLLETKGQLQAALAQNDKLTETLRGARDQLAPLREEVERLAAPPQSYATFLGHDADAGHGDRRRLRPQDRGQRRPRGRRRRAAVGPGGPAQRGDERRRRRPRSRTAARS